jgi:putative holliday junction resolvase
VSTAEASGGREPPDDSGRAGGVNPLLRDEHQVGDKDEQGADAPRSPIPTKGSLLGIDYGTVRVGLAVCDYDRLIASPLDTYARKSEATDAAYFRKVVAEQRAVGLVVGLPLHASGEESDSSRDARAYGAWLANLTALPVVFWDERLTTWLAEEALLGAKLSHAKRKDRRDRVAAQMILKGYLDAGCPPEGTRAGSVSHD